STDGTAAGTKLIANLTASKFFNFGNAVYFFADGKNGSQDLWRTNGTAKGTTLIKAGLGVGYEAAVAGDSFYFYNGVQLWNSDGTAPGTKLVRQFGTGFLPATVFITAVGKR